MWLGALTGATHDKGDRPLHQLHQEPVSPLRGRPSCLMLRAAALAAAWIVFAGCALAAQPAPIEVKVVVVTMFEIGADSGDTPGEFQLWHERQKLDERFPFAHHHDLFMNPSTGVLVMVTGEGTANSASAVMELGMDPRFDLS